MPTGVPYGRAFQVRSYECDAYGHVNNTNYLRYMAETATSAALALPGGDQAGNRWLTLTTDIEYLRPLRFGDSVEVVTWAAATDGHILRRAFEFRLAGSGEPIARAQSDLALLAADCQQATVLPSTVLAACFPAGWQDAPLEPQPFPVAPPAPPGVFCMRREVAWRDLGPDQRMDEARYLEYIEDCSMQVIAAHRWPITRMWQAGFAIIMRRHQIQYLRPAALGDLLEVATWFSDVKRATATRHYTITRLSDGALLARVHTLGVWIDLASGRPIRVPAGLMDDFAPNMAA